MRVLASHVPIPVHFPCICLCFFNLCLAAVLAFVSYCWVHDLRPSPTEEIWSRSPILWMFTASTVNLGHGTAGSKQGSKVYYVRYLSSCRLPYQIRTKPLSYCALPNIEHGLKLGTYSSLPVHGTLEMMMTVVTVAGITRKRPSNAVVSSRVWPDMTNFPACQSANTEFHIPRSPLPHLVTWTINRIVL